MPQVIIPMEEWQELSSRPTLDAVKESNKIILQTVLEASSYVCVHDREQTYDRYCDGCPVLAMDYQIMRNGGERVCDRQRSHSK